MRFLVKTIEKSFVYIGTPLFPVEKWLKLILFATLIIDTRRMAALPSLYRLANLYGPKGGCLCTAGDHPAILIDFNHEQIS